MSQGDVDEFGGLEVPNDDQIFQIRYSLFDQMKGSLMASFKMIIPQLGGFRIPSPGIFCHFSHLTSKGKHCSLWTGEKTGLGLGRMVGLRSAEVSSGCRGG